MIYKRNSSYSAITPIPEKWYIEAELRASALPVLKNSHREGEANGVGCLGEVIAENWMALKDIVFEPQLKETTHDYIVSGDIKVDVKTKDRTVKPKIDYDNSAPLYNHDHQRPDFFLFISLHRNSGDTSKDLRRFHSAYILGSISYEELDAIGIPFLKGEKDWRNGTTFWTDCLNVQMSQLIPLSDTVELFKKTRTQPKQKASANPELISKMQFMIASGQLAYRKLPFFSEDVVE